MDFEELMRRLEMDGAAEFVYFEQFAELMECPDDISADAVQALVAAAEPDTLGELTESYFEDVLQFVPDDATDLFTLLQTIETTLASLGQAAGDEESSRLCAEELCKFRNWYLFEGRVRREDLAEGGESELSVMEALADCRLQNLDGGDYVYDFSEALDYPIDEYIISLTSLLEDDYGDGDVDEWQDYNDPDEDGE
jgi:hypothetical protein